MRKLFLALVLSLLATAASAQTYQYKDNTGTVFNIRVWTCGGSTCTGMVLEDTSGNAIGTLANPLRFDPVGTTTQPVSIATLPLPSGAATSANQPTNVAQGSTTSGQTGRLVFGAVSGIAPSYSNAQSSPISLDTTGNLRVNCITGCSSTGGTGQADESAFTQGTTSLTVAGGIFTTSVTNLTTGQAGAVRLTNDRKMMVDTPNIEVAATTSGATAASQAAQVAGVFNSAAPTLTNGQAIALQLTSAGSLHNTVDNVNANGQATMANSSPVAIASNQSAVPTTVGAAATGGASTTGNIAANNTTAVVVKSSAGTLYGVQLGGIGSAPAYLKIYNATSATCGSGTPVKRLIIPAAPTAANGAGSNVAFGPAGIAFGTGITYCVTTGIADNDTTAPAASTFLINMDYD